MFWNLKLNSSFKSQQYKALSDLKSKQRTVSHIYIFTDNKHGLFHLARKTFATQIYYLKSII